METHNPATGELVDTYEEDSPSEVDAALDRAVTADEMSLVEISLP